MLTFEKNFAPDQDGRTPFAFAAWRLQMCDLAAELSFDPQNIGSAGTFSEWQQQVKVRLRQLLHIPAADPTQPPPKLLESRQRDTYTVNLYEAYPDKWSKVRFLMLVPENISAPVPLVLCFPGSHH